MRYLFAILLLALPAPLSARKEAEKTPIAIVELETRGVSRQDAQILTDKLQSSLVAIDRYIILERSKIDEILKEQGFQASGCTSEECMVEMGQLLGVRKLVTGSVGKIGESYFVSIRMVDIETGKIEGSADETLKGDPGDVLRFSIPSIVRKLTKYRYCYKQLAVFARHKFPDLEFDDDYRAALYLVCNYPDEFKVSDFVWDTTCVGKK